MWELDYKESCVLKNWWFWTMVLEKILESPLDCKEIQPVHPEGDQSLVFIGRTDVEAETPILWPPDAKSWLIWKDPDSRRDWGQEEKGMTEDEMVGWHHRLDGHGFRWPLEVGDGQGDLSCYSSWGCKQSDTTERLNWTELNCPYSWSVTAHIARLSKTELLQIKEKQTKTWHMAVAISLLWEAGRQSLMLYSLKYLVDFCLCKVNMKIKWPRLARP